MRRAALAILAVPPSGGLPQAVGGRGRLCAAAPSIADSHVEHRKLRVGLLSIGTDPARPGPQWTAFLGGLRTLGYVEGQNIVIERRFAAGNEQRVTNSPPISCSGR